MNSRISSVDIFRAITMFLMIFVNDLWTLHGIPGWLEHTKAHDDGMGLADTVFPAFLFIVGLSIPFAIRNRIRKGDSRMAVLVHIARRSLALIVMGFFMVNEEMFRHSVPEGFRTVWSIMMIIAFMLIWNEYPVKKIGGRFPVYLLQITGIVILAILALTYKGGTPDHPGWMKPHWWGILGLIGWAYLVCALIYLFSGGKLWVIFLAWIILHAMNVLEFIPVSLHMPHFLIVVSASNHALVMGGVLTTVIYLRLRERKSALPFQITLLSLAALSILYGFWLRPLWGISKILATPSWTAICTGISIAVFLVLFIVTDVFQYKDWARIIMPAGQSTLTCYLVPDLLYPVVYPLEQLLPAFLLAGGFGLLKSLLFTLGVIVITGLLQRIHIHLKI